MSGWLGWQQSERRPDASVTLQVVAGLAILANRHIKTTILRGPGGCRKLIQMICDDLWRWEESHQAMSGCEEVQSPAK